MTHIKKDNPANLPGYQKKSFSLFYNGGEIWCEHLDGLYENTSLVLEKLEKDYAIFKKASCSRFIALNVDETILTDSLIEKITNIFSEDILSVRKLAIIGTSFWCKQKLKRAFLIKNAHFPISYYRDFEKAKTWLIP